MTPTSKARAQCGNSARWDLRGGRAKTPVPTATVCVGAGAGGLR
jgi:hypothetical protein